MTLENAVEEIARLIESLRSAGWSDKKINDFLMYIDSGKEKQKSNKK